MKQEMPQSQANHEAEPIPARVRSERFVTLKRIALHAGLATATFAFVIYTGLGHKPNFDDHTSEPKEELGPTPKPEIPDLVDQQAALDIYERRLREQELKKAAVVAHVSELVGKCAPVTYFSGGTVTSHDIYAKQVSSRGVAPILVTYDDLGILSTEPTDRHNEPYAIVSVQADQAGTLTAEGCPVVSYSVDLTESTDQVRQFTDSHGQDYVVPQIDIQEAHGFEGELKTGVLYPAYDANGLVTGLQSSTGERVGVFQPQSYTPSFTG